MYVDFAEVEELALGPEFAHSFVDWPLTGRVLLHIAHHYKSSSQLAYAMRMVNSKRSYH